MENEEILNLAFDPVEPDALWAQGLDEFERKTWPVFERRGYSRDTALLAFLLGGLSRQLAELADPDFIIEFEEDDDPTWDED